MRKIPDLIKEKAPKGVYTEYSFNFSFCVCMCICACEICIFVWFPCIPMCLYAFCSSELCDNTYVHIIFYAVERVLCVYI